MKINYQRLFISIIIPLVLGGLVAILTVPNSGIESKLPGWVFMVVWSIIYVLMGVSCYLIYQDTLEIPKVYITNLIFNYLWCFIFFRLKWFVFAFIWIIILFFITLKMIKEFKTVNKLAGNLQIPYTLWLIVAAILNLMYII